MYTLLQLAFRKNHKIFDNFHNLKFYFDFNTKNILPVTIFPNDYLCQQFINAVLIFIYLTLTLIYCAVMLIEVCI